MREILVPEYLEQFQCIGGACEDTCCAGWGVSIDKKTYQLYKKVKHPELDEKLKKYVKRNRKDTSDLNYGKFLLDNENKCHMLTDEGLCGIQIHLGEEALCNTCTVYPRTFSNVGNVIEKSLTLSCPEAARIVLLREEGLGFIQTEEPKSTRGFIEKALDLNNKPFFWDLRIFIIQLIQNRKQPLEIRLILLGLFFQKIEGLSNSELQVQLPSIMEDYSNRLDNEEFITTLKNIEGKTEFQINLMRDLIGYRLSVGISSPRYTKLFGKMINGLALNEDVQEFNMEMTLGKYRESVENFYKPFMDEKEYMLENYIVNYVFKNLVPYDHQTLFESYMMLVVHLNLIKIHLIGMAAEEKKLTEEMIVECVQQLAKIIEHNNLYLINVRDGMKESGYNSMAHMFILIKS